MKTTSEAAFETAIEAVLLGGGYARVEGKGFDRERAIFPDEALAFIRARCSSSSAIPLSGSNAIVSIRSQAGAA